MTARILRCCACGLITLLMIPMGCASRPVATASAMPHQPLPSALSLICKSCHNGPDQDRHAVDLSTVSVGDIADALRAWRDASREGTVMPRLARTLSDAEIEQLAHELGRAP